MQQLLVRIVVVNPPIGVLFAVQSGRSELLGPCRIEDGWMTFDVTVRVAEDDRGQAPDFRGPVVQGPRGGRFLYVNSGRRAGQLDSACDRRAKVRLEGITWALVKAARAKGGVVEARFEGVGRDGGPACGSVPLLRKWTVVAE